MILVEPVAPGLLNPYPSERLVTQQSQQIKAVLKYPGHFAFLIRLWLTFNAAYNSDVNVWEEKVAE